jgi:hypothetical protein
MPENGFYYHLAYAAAIVIYVFYGLSLYLRRSRLRK